MVVSTNGRLEQRTDGLWIHHGKLNLGPVGSGAAGAPLGTSGDLVVNRGDNTGAIYFAGQDKYIYYTGAQFVFAPALTSTALAPGAAQQFLGSYRAIAGFTISTPNVWNETNAQVTVTTTGGMVRVEACGTLIAQTAGQLIYVGTMVDAGIGGGDSLQAFQPLALNQITGFSVVNYYASPAGTHRYSVMLYSPNGNGGLWAGGYQQVWVNEQRR